MNYINKCLEKLWDGPVTCVALFVVLMTVSILITGVGVHSAAVWIVLASASVLCLALCSCVKCKKRASRWRRTSEPEDTVSTISDVNDFMHIMYPGGGDGASPYWRRDSLPDYAAVTGPDQLPPPYSLVARPRAEHTASTQNADDAADAEPPSYDAVVNSLQILRVSVAPDTDSIRAPRRLLGADKACATEATVIEMQPDSGRTIIECQPEVLDSSTC